MTALSGAAAGFHDALALDVALYTIVAGCAAFVCATSVSILTGLGPRSMKEMKRTDMFHGNNSYMMVAPFVSAWLLLLLRFTVVSPKSVDWSVERGAAFGLMVWLTTSAHGIWMDFTTFKMGPDLLVNWWMCSAIMATVTGATIGYFF